MLQNLKILEEKLNGSKCARLLTGVENNKVHMDFTAHFRCLHCSERIYNNILMMKFGLSCFPSFWFCNINEGAGNKHFYSFWRFLTVGQNQRLRSPSTCWDFFSKTPNPIKKKQTFEGESQLLQRPLE